MSKIDYRPIELSELPKDLRFDTPGMNQGQHVEVSYADYPARKCEAYSGAAYMKVHDRSQQKIDYFKSHSLKKSAD